MCMSLWHLIGLGKISTETASGMFNSFLLRDVVVNLLFSVLYTIFLRFSQYYLIFFKIHVWMSYLWILCSGYQQKEAFVIPIILPFVYHGFTNFNVHLVIAGSYHKRPNSSDLATRCCRVPLVSFQTKNVVRAYLR